MAALTTKAVVDRVQAALAAALASSWRLSRQHPASFGRDARQIAHLAYVVWAPTAEAVEVTRWRGREKIADGVVTRTALEVAFAARVRPDSASADADAAYDNEDTLRKAVLTSALTDLHLAWLGAARELAGDGTYSIHRLSFEAEHRLALA